MSQKRVTKEARPAALEKNVSSHLKFLHCVSLLSSVFEGQIVSISVYCLHLSAEAHTRQFNCI